MQCDCQYTGGAFGSIYDIDRCPLHAAAPELFSKLKSLAAAASPAAGGDDDLARAVDAAYDAIAKAEQG